MADDGHVVGNHSWSHPLIPKLSRPPAAAGMPTLAALRPVR
ncbi:polysaccharide deacetylase family protein [Streptomyces parvus]